MIFGGMQFPRAIAPDRSGLARRRARSRLLKSHIALLHAEVPQDLSDQGYGSRLAHGIFEALRRDGKG